MIFKRWVLAITISTLSVAYAANQTADTSPILSGSDLPFDITIEKEAFELPVGLHSGAVAIYNGQWVFIGGRTNGLHGFINNGSFPEPYQNKAIYVVNFLTKSVYSRDLTDVSSGLTTEQIEILSTTDPEFYQVANTLYYVGGYGVDSRLGSLNTKPYLTAINIPGIINWVVKNQGSVAENIQQIQDPTFQITGGAMLKVGDTMNLIFGQNFTGEYSSSSNGDYSRQVRRFNINANPFGVSINPTVPSFQEANYRRRDLNVVPVMFANGRSLEYGYAALGGVFTTTTGVWTVPVTVRGNGEPAMQDPSATGVLKQGFNVYKSAYASLYSRRNSATYNLLFGGLTYEYYSGGTLVQDSEVPFTNQIVTVKMDNQGNFSQYLMDGEFPRVEAPIGLGRYFFGASAYFFPNFSVSRYSNNVINADSFRGPTVIGYIVGGIASPVLNTTASLVQTVASPYIFRVIYTPK